MIMEDQADNHPLIFSDLLEKKFHFYATLEHYLHVIQLRCHLGDNIHFVFFFLPYS